MATWGLSFGDSWLATWDRTPAAFPDAPLTNVQMQQLLAWVNELALIHGLVSGSNLVVTPTARSAGAVEQAIATVGSTVTVSR